MKQQSLRVSVPSLTQHFDAPEDYSGHFGWLCGYSADADFLNNAAERFTGLTEAQRASQGRIALTVCLDPHNSPISLSAMPGVMHLLARQQESPFRLLHAKVALLGFRHRQDPENWQLRLLISTGNWTRQTLENSLDLIWRVDVRSEELLSTDETTQQNCADIKASWELLSWIQTHFDSRLLDIQGQDAFSVTQSPHSQVQRWITKSGRKARGKARVFDNRKHSLLKQLVNKISVKSESRRNFLALGSGFYETSSSRHRAPEVPLAIVKTLRKAELLTAKPYIDLYINPAACQAIATTADLLYEAGIRVRPAVVPARIYGPESRRTLHAKFLFSATSRQGKCTNGWVYLGSGNLTRPGFSEKMSPERGNLEVGVIFTPSTLPWMPDNQNPHQCAVTDLLPIQCHLSRDTALAGTDYLASGEDWTPSDQHYVAPPIAWLSWLQDSSGNALSSDMTDIEIEVLDLSGQPCSQTNGHFIWTDAQPREVRIRWKSSDKYLEGSVPVIDKFGRIAAKELVALDIEEAGWQLLSFPGLPDDEDKPELDRALTTNGSSDEVNRRSDTPTTYPVRQMMSLIENIAMKQTSLRLSDWSFWCQRLEQTLTQAEASPSVRFFREQLQLNPLSPLYLPMFRPSFAENSATDAGKYYEQVLERVESDWGMKPDKDRKPDKYVDGLAPVGDQK